MKDNSKTTEAFSLVIKNIISLFSALEPTLHH